MTNWIGGTRESERAALLEKAQSELEEARRMVIQLEQSVALRLSQPSSAAAAYTTIVTCPRCSRWGVSLNAELQMSSHVVSFGIMGELLTRGIMTCRPRCPASGRRVENALVEGSIAGKQ